jgi:hypothetical protein
MPTASDVQDAYSKLERAEHHINDLSGRIDAFLAQNPFKLIEHTRRKASQVAFRIKTEKRIPPDFPLIIGDAVHNLRAALDLMLFSLAAPRAPSPGNIQFPFPKADTENALIGTIASGQVKFAGEKVAETIYRLNPRPTGNRILHGIYTLDLSDKHRLLILSRGIPEFTGDTFRRVVGKNRGINIEIGAGGSLRLAAPENQDALVINNVPFVLHDLPDSQQEAKVQPAFVITFGKGGAFESESVIQVLRDAARAIKSALDDMLVAYLDPENRFPA